MNTLYLQMKLLMHMLIDSWFLLDTELYDSKAHKTYFLKVLLADMDVKKSKVKYAIPVFEVRRTGSCVPVVQAISFMW